MDVETEMHFLMDSKQVGTIYLLKLNSEDVFKIYNSAQDKQKICKNIFVRKTMSNKSTTVCFVKFEETTKSSMTVCSTI